MKDYTVEHTEELQVICVFEVKPKSMSVSLLQGERSSMPPRLFGLARLKDALWIGGIKRHRKRRQ